MKNNFQNRVRLTDIVYQGVASKLHSIFKELDDYFPNSKLTTKTIYSNDIMNSFANRQNQGQGALTFPYLAIKHEDHDENANSYPSGPMSRTFFTIKSNEFLNLKLQLLPQLTNSTVTFISDNAKAVEDFTTLWRFAKHKGLLSFHVDIEDFRVDIRVEAGNAITIPEQDNNPSSPQNYFVVTAPIQIHGYIAKPFTERDLIKEVPVRRIIVDGHYVKDINAVTATQMQVMLPDFSITISIDSEVVVKNNDIITDDLLASIHEAGSLDEADYTEESWDILSNALEYANEIKNKENTTQHEVDLAAENLVTAIQNLDRLTEPESEPESEPEPEPEPEPLVNKENLLVVLNLVEELKPNEENYTEFSWQHLIQEYDSALLIYNDPDAEQSDINEATTDLLDAIEELEDI